MVKGQAENIIRQNEARDRTVQWGRKWGSRWRLDTEACMKGHNPCKETTAVQISNTPYIVFGNISPFYRIF